MKRLSLGLTFAMLVIGLVAADLGFPVLSLSPSSVPITFLSPAPAAAQTPAKQVRLKFATHLPTMHHAYRNYIGPWAAEVEKRTEGRVKITVYTDSQLGKLPEMYD